jgi:hypothetical protein
MGHYDDESRDAKADFEWEFYDEFPDATDEQLEAAWAHEQALMEPTGVVSSPRPAPEPTKPGSPRPVDRDRELDFRSRRRPEDRRLEARFIDENIGGAVIEGGNPGRGGKGKAPSSPHAVRILRDGELVELREIGNDQAAIRDWLARFRPADEYAAAIRRGRRTPEIDALRRELALRVVELLDRGATRIAVAGALGCSEKAVGALARFGSK